MNKEKVFELMEISMQEIILANKVLKNLDKEPIHALRQIKKNHFEWVIKTESELIQQLKTLI